MVSIQSLVEVKDRLRIRSLLAGQCLAELLAVFVLMLLIQGSSAQAVTSGGTKGYFFTVFLAGSLGIMLAIYVSGNVSGAHLNPAFSLPMCVQGHLPWARFLSYSLLQLLSAFCASGVPYALYLEKAMASHSSTLAWKIPWMEEPDALQNYPGGSLTATGPKETASIFATYPAPYLSLSNGFLDQVLGTWKLMVGMAILDMEQGSACRSGARGSGVTDPGRHAIHGCQLWAPNRPCPGPRPTDFHLVLAMVGGGFLWWGSLVGAMLRTATYQLLVAKHHPEDSEPSQDLECAQQEASDSGSPAATQLQESKL